jgi:hypothetical protein
LNSKGVKIHCLPDGFGLIESPGFIAEEKKDNRYGMFCALKILETPKCRKI